ncbi:MAG: hypothetical protein P8180_11935 [Gammaproteobacteria bacterium]
MTFRYFGGLSLILLSLEYLSGCVSMPAPGDKFVMVIKKFPTTRHQLEDYPGLTLALESGVTRPEVKSGRLVRSGCYFEGSRRLSFGRRFGFTLVPRGIKVKPGDTILISAEQADGTDGPYARFFGRYLGGYSASETEFFNDKYVSDRTFRCGPISSEGLMAVEVISTVHYWDYDLAKAELARNSQISDAELSARRIAMGECSPGVDSWALWNVRIPPGLHVKVGDYIEAIAGANSRSVSTGAISKAIRKVAAPPWKDFIFTQGRYTVSCSAHAQ